MFGAGWLNIGSLVLGLIAWTLPVINLEQQNKAGCRNWADLCLRACRTESGLFSKYYEGVYKNCYLHERRK